MAHGQPDYGLYTSKKTTYGLADSGELAARLGSIITHDRRGDVIWFDDFNSDMGGWIIGGTGGTAIQTAERCRHRGFCCKLSTSAIAGQYIEVTRRFPYPVLSKLGAEISFTVDNGVSRYVWLLDVFDSVNYYYARVQYLTATNELQVYDNAVWTTIDVNLNLMRTTYLFNTIKLVGDFNVPRGYVRLILNDIEYDITPYTFFFGGHILASHAAIHFQAYAAAAAVAVSYLDDAIVTQNEP